MNLIRKNRKEKEKKEEGREETMERKYKILIQREFIQFIYIRIILELIREREREREIYPTNLFKNLFLNQQVYN